MLPRLATELMKSCVRMSACVPLLTHLFHVYRIAEKGFSWHVENVDVLLTVSERTPLAGGYVGL